MASKRSEVIDDTVETPVAEVKAAIAEVMETGTASETSERNASSQWESETADEVQVAEEPPEKKSSWLRGGLILLALALIVSSFLLEDDGIELERVQPVASGDLDRSAATPSEESNVAAENNQVSVEDTPPLTVEVSTASAEGAAESAATAQPAQPKSNPDVIEEGQQAREFIAAVRETGQTQGVLKQVYDEAEALRKAGALADSYLLYFYAARKGDASAAMYLAGISDPRSFDPNNGVLEQPEPFNAYRWYSMAEQSGNKEAAKKLQQLKQWSEAEAAKGNAQAQRLMLQWR